MNSSPLKDARLRIELDTADAQARLDRLEERFEELGGDIDETSNELKDQQKQANKISRQRNEREGRDKPNMDNTGPGKFGLRQIPQLLGAAELAGAVGGPVGNAAKLVVGLEQRYGAVAEGLIEGSIDQMPITPAVKAAIKGATTQMNERLRKFTTEIDLKLKSFMPALDQAIEMSKAVLVTGGHLNSDKLTKFIWNSYDWQFVQARKDKDIRDKTLKMIAHQVPGLIKDLFMQASEGKFSP